MIIIIIKYIGMYCSFSILLMSSGKEDLFDSQFFNTAVLQYLEVIFYSALYTAATTSKW